MTGILVLVALVIAAGIAVWVVRRSRAEAPGTSGVDPTATEHEPEEPREQ